MKLIKIKKGNLFYIDNWDLCVVFGSETISINVKLSKMPTSKSLQNVKRIFIFEILVEFLFEITAFICVQLYNI